MGPDEFKREYLCEPNLDEEYLYYFDLWMEYRKLTWHSPISKSKEVYRLHKEMFEGIPRNGKYYQAKDDSFRFYEKDI